MKAMNMVRFRVKPGCQDRFVEYHRELRPTFKGYLGGSLVRTGEQTFCIAGQWKSLDHLAAARPQMIEFLDGMRDLLEDLGGDLGVTDPVSGEVVAELSGSKAAGKKKAAKEAAAKAKPAKKKDKKKAEKKDGKKGKAR